MKLIFRFLLGCLPVLAVALIILEIVASNELVGQGKKLELIDASIASEKEDYEILMAKIASASSLIAMRDKAEKLGFVEPAKSQILSIVHDQFPVAISFPR